MDNSSDTQAEIETFLNAALPRLLAETPAPEPIPEPIGQFDLTKCTPELFASIIEAQGLVNTVGKDGHNTQHHYKYATADSMILHAREVLNRCGLGMIHTWAVDEIENPNPRGAGTWLGGWAIVDVILFNASGHMLRGKVRHAIICLGAKPLDKGAAGTVTHALGFILRGLLLIDRSENPKDSVDERDDTGGEFSQGRPVFHGRDEREQEREQAPEPSRPPAPTPAQLERQAAKIELGAAIKRYKEAATAATGEALSSEDMRDRVAFVMGLNGGWPDEPSTGMIQAAAIKVLEKAAEFEEDQDLGISENYTGMAPPGFGGETEAEPEPAPEKDPTVEPAPKKTRRKRRTKAEIAADKAKAAKEDELTAAAAEATEPIEGPDPGDIDALEREMFGEDPNAEPGGE